MRGLTDRWRPTLRSTEAALISIVYRAMDVDALQVCVSRSFYLKSGPIAVTTYHGPPLLQPRPDPYCPPQKHKIKIRLGDRRPLLSFFINLRAVAEHLAHQHQPRCLRLPLLLLLGIVANALLLLQPQALTPKGRLTRRRRPNVSEDKTVAV